MKRHGYWLGNEDEQAILIIKKRYGCVSDSQAIRLAIRMLANSETVTDVWLPEQPKHARLSPKK